MMNKNIIRYLLINRKEKRGKWKKAERARSRFESVRSLEAVAHQLIVVHLFHFIPLL